MDHYAISAILTSICVFILGFLVLTNNPRSRTNILFFLLSFSISWWSLGLFMHAISTTKETTLFWGRFLHIGAILIPIFLYALSTVLTKVYDERKPIIILSYLLTIAFIILDFTPLFISGVSPKHGYPYWVNPGILYPFHILMTASLVIASVLELWIKLIKAKGIQKTQLKYFLIAVLLGYGGGSLNYLLNYNIKIFMFSPYITYSVLIYVGITSYAILRHRLMDIEVIIKKGIVYSTLMAFIVGIYSLLIFIGQNIFQTALGINQWIATIITALVIAVGYKPLETFVTDLTNQYFFRKKYDYQKTLKESSEAMNLLTDIDRLVKLTTRIVARRMDLVETSTLIYEEPHHRYIVRAAEGKSKEMLGTTYSDNFELFKHLFSSKNILVKDEVTQTLNNKLVLPDERKRLNTIRKDMEKLHAQVCVPSITRGKYMGNKLVAIFCMGEKKSGDIYSNEDIQLLSTLSNQAAVAIENALMYSDLMKQFQELKETKDQLVQSEKLAALGTMAAGIAHEIKNPLTSLQLFVQMMAERFDDHEFREKFTQVVPPEVERLNRIVNDLVSFAKPSKLIREPAQINDILEKTIRLSEISFKKLNVKVAKEFSEMPKVIVDSQQIMQIFLNLIMNGAQAMPQGGILTVKTYYDDIYKKVCIDVRDTGHGISEENKKKIFAPFFSTKEGGTGLGLAITKRIIDEHKGEIKVKSVVGEGTTFTVEFPVAS